MFFRYIGGADTSHKKFALIPRNKLRGQIYKERSLLGDLQSEIIIAYLFNKSQISILISKPVW